MSWEKYKDKTTEGLINLYQCSETKESVSDDVFLAICFRFREKLINICERICKKRGYDNDVAVEIAESTFIKYGKSKKFNFNKRKQLSIDDSFKIYLYYIARNLLNDYYNVSQKKQNGQYYDGSERIIKDVDFSKEKLSGESKILNDTLQSFSYKHRVIFYTYKIHEKEGVKLPRKLHAELREYLKLEQGTIRAYKKEVIDKLKEVTDIIKKTRHNE